MLWFAVCLVEASGDCGLCGCRCVCRCLMVVCLILLFAWLYCLFSIRDLVYGGV